MQRLVWNKNEPVNPRNENERDVAFFPFISTTKTQWLQLVAHGDLVTSWSFFRCKMSLALTFWFVMSRLHDSRIPWEKLLRATYTLTATQFSPLVTFTCSTSCSLAEWVHLLSRLYSFNHLYCLFSPFFGLKARSSWPRSPVWSRTPFCVQFACFFFRMEYEGFLFMLRFPPTSPETRRLGHMVTLICSIGVNFSVNSCPVMSQHHVQDVTPH